VLAAPGSLLWALAAEFSPEARLAAKHAWWMRRHALIHRYYPPGSIATWQPIFEVHIPVPPDNGKAALASRYSHPIAGLLNLSLLGVVSSDWRGPRGFQLARLRYLCQ